MSPAQAELAERLKQAIKVAKLSPGLLAEYSVYYSQHEDEVLRAFGMLEELTDTPDVEAFVKTVLKAVNLPAGVTQAGAIASAEPLGEASSAILQALNRLEAKVDRFAYMSEIAYVSAFRTRAVSSHSSHNQQAVAAYYNALLPDGSKAEGCKVEGSKAEGSEAEGSEVEVIDTYSGPDANPPKLFCLGTGKYFTCDSIKISHIYQSSWCPEEAVMLKIKKHSESNLVPLHKNIERALDNLQITVVPTRLNNVCPSDLSSVGDASSVNSANSASSLQEDRERHRLQVEYKMLVLDPALKNDCIYDVGGKKEKFESLDGKLLQFPKGCNKRPAVRCFLAHNKHAFMRAYLMGWASRGTLDHYLRYTPTSPSWGCDPQIFASFLWGSAIEQ